MAERAEHTNDLNIDTWRKQRRGESKQRTTRKRKQAEVNANTTEMESKSEDGELDVVDAEFVLHIFDVNEEGFAGHMMAQDLPIIDAVVGLAILV